MTPTVTILLIDYNRLLTTEKAMKGKPNSIYIDDHFSGNEMFNAYIDDEVIDKFKEVIEYKLKEYDHFQDKKLIPKAKKSFLQSLLDGLK